MSSKVLPVSENPHPKRPALECRVYERLACEIPTVCQPASVQEMKEARWQGTISDISQGGVRLKLKRRFEAGAGLAVELPGDGVHESSIVFAKVVHLRRHDDGDWLLGCKFLSELSEDQLQRLIQAERYILSPPKTDEPAAPSED
jgi:hypothetical protein